MALFLDGGKVKLFLDGVAYRLLLCSKATDTPNIKLLSSDGYILKEANGVYLIPRATTLS